jgi:hypothetical protein
MANPLGRGIYIGFSRGLLLFVAMLQGQRGFATTELIFAQVADGGGYRTTILLTNPSGTATTATIAFCDNAGNPLIVMAGGVLSSSFTLPLPSAGSARLQTAGNPSDVSSGWARVTTSPAVDINGNAVFQYFRSNVLYSEASVTASIPTDSADFYADEDGGFNTGFAVANPTLAPAIGTLTLHSNAGNIVGTAAINLGPGQHLPVFLFQVFPNAPSGRAQIRLTSGTLAITALRYHSSSIFSTVSVGQPSASITVLFSPGGGVRARIISEINKAQSTIDIAVYSFTLDEVREALISARQRGVAIRIVADASQAVLSGGEIPALEQLGFSIRRISGLGNGIMHNKYMIVDGATLFTGSYNFSYSAENYNFENALFIQGSPVLRNYISDFNALWAK